MLQLSHPQKRGLKLETEELGSNRVDMRTFYGKKRKERDEERIKRKIGFKNNKSEKTSSIFWANIR